MSFLQKLRRSVPCLLALATAFVSNFLFTGEWFTRFHNLSGGTWTQRQTWGTVCLIAAVAFSAWSFSKRDNFLPWPAFPEIKKTPAWDLRKGILFIPCLLFYFSAQLLYFFQGENNLVRWCWVLSILFLIIPLIRSFDWRDFWPLPFWEYILLLLIVAGAFTLRYVDLTQVPYHVDNDVSIMGLYSRTLIENHDWRWIGMAPTAHQFSEHQKLALSMRLFGMDHYGLVMFSVLCGTATVAVTYFLGKILFNRWVGFIAAGFLATNYAHIHFSRIIFGAMVGFFIALSGLFLFHGLRRSSKLSFALSGLSLGTGLLGYYSGRVGPVIVACVFALCFWQRKKFKHITLSYWLAGLAGMLFVFGPNLIYGLVKPEELHGRGNDVILWTDGAWSHLSQKYNSEGNPLVVLKEQVKRTLLAPFYFPDSSTICNLQKPMLGAMAALVLMLGLGFCFRRLGDISCTYPLIWIGLTFLCGGILTIDPPFWPHLNVAVPALALVSAVGAERFSRQLILLGGKPALALIPALLVAGIFFSGIHNWEVYYRSTWDYSNGRVRAARQIERLTSDFRVYLISPDVRWEHATFQFLTPHVEGHNLAEKDLYQNPPPINKPTAFFIFENADQNTIGFLSQTYKGSSRKILFSGFFTLVEFFPEGYMEKPRNYYRQPNELMWNLKGWRYVSALLGILILLGWMALMRDMKSLKKNSEPVLPSTS